MWCSASNNAPLGLREMPLGPMLVANTPSTTHSKVDQGLTGWHQLKFHYLFPPILLPLPSLLGVDLMGILLWKLQPCICSEQTGPAVLYFSLFKGLLPKDPSDQ